MAFEIRIKLVNAVLQQKWVGNMMLAWFIVANARWCRTLSFTIKDSKFSDLFEGTKKKKELYGEWIKNHINWKFKNFSVIQSFCNISEVFGLLATRIPSVELLSSTHFFSCSRFPWKNKVFHFTSIHQTSWSHFSHKTSDVFIKRRLKQQTWWWLKVIAHNHVSRGVRRAYMVKFIVTKRSTSYGRRREGFELS